MRPPAGRRWTALRKAQLLEALRRGEVTRADALAQHGLSRRSSPAGRPASPVTATPA